MKLPIWRIRLEPTHFNAGMDCLKENFILNRMASDNLNYVKLCNPSRQVLPEVESAFVNIFPKDSIERLNEKLFLFFEIPKADFIWPAQCYPNSKGCLRGTMGHWNKRNNFLSNHNSQLHGSFFLKIYRRGTTCWRWLEFMKKKSLNNSCIQMETK